MIRFFNGRTLTMADGVSVTTDEVWTDGDKIAYIGPTPETLPAFERQIDLGGDLVMPGFKNAHAHAGMSFVRSYADDVPLQPWLFEQIFPLEAKLTPEAVYAFTKLSILEYLTSGITAGFDLTIAEDIELYLYDGQGKKMDERHIPYENIKGGKPYTLELSYSGNAYLVAWTLTGNEDINKTSTALHDDES